MDNALEPALWAGLGVLIIGLMACIAALIALWSWRRAQAGDALEILQDMGGRVRAPDLRRKMEEVEGISIGGFYLIMERLESSGMVESVNEDGGPERNLFPVRVYALTDKGREEIRRRGAAIC